MLCIYTIDLNRSDTFQNVTKILTFRLHPRSFTIFH